jgi:hypothetical protein
MRVCIHSLCDVCMSCRSELLILLHSMMISIKKKTKASDQAQDGSHRTWLQQFSILTNECWPDTQASPMVKRRRFRVRRPDTRSQRRRLGRQARCRADKQGHAPAPARSAGGPHANGSSTPSGSCQFGGTEQGLITLWHRRRNGGWSDRCRPERDLFYGQVGPGAGHPVSPPRPLPTSFSPLHARRWPGPRHWPVVVLGSTNGAADLASAPPGRNGLGPPISPERGLGPSSTRRAIGY